MILSSCYHFAALASEICEFNQRAPDLRGPEQSTIRPIERAVNSEIVDKLSFLYMNNVINCYSALDMLYELFVYYTREPFVNPEFPQNLHFPDTAGRAIFRYGGAPQEIDPPADTFEMAIPNLDRGHFGALRQTRNDLVHNMAADGTRPTAYIGYATPLVNNMSLQYAQYLTRDIDNDTGKPVATSWCRRFYQHQSDAQTTLYGWIEQAWQCIFDTIDWLTHRMAGHYTSSTGVAS